MMIIRNLTRKKEHEHDVKVCRSIFSQARGLMFSGKRVLLFCFGCEKKVPLHMLFVFFPIDAIFLDNNKRVVENARLSPFQLYFSPQNKATYLIEAPVGLISAKEGDLLDF